MTIDEFLGPERFASDGQLLLKNELYRLLTRMLMNSALVATLVTVQEGLLNIVCASTTQHHTIWY